jgi:hypothetical protein
MRDLIEFSSWLVKATILLGVLGIAATVRLEPVRMDLQLWQAAAVLFLPLVLLGGVLELWRWWLTR